VQLTVPIARLVRRGTGDLRRVEISGSCDWAESHGTKGDPSVSSPCGRCLSACYREDCLVREPREVRFSSRSNMQSSEYYHHLRAVYQPADPKVVFVAESPPVSGHYFYDPSGKVGEPLFRAMMRDVLDKSPESKAEGLQAFKERGYLLVDATYFPVNKHLSDRERDDRIIADYPLLVEDLTQVIRTEGTRIILIKVNICRLLEPKFVSDGFNVVNKGRIVPFPAFGNQARFRRVIAAILS